jgi:hypothetical protein
MEIQKDDVIKRLASFGYTYNAAEFWVLDFVIDKVTNIIKNNCNISDIPAELYEIAVDMVCGEFLLGKKNGGQLDGFDVDLNSTLLKSVQSGDTSVEFGAGNTKTAEERVDLLINWLLNANRGQFATFRKLKWT